MPLHHDVDKCVSDWLNSKITRDEVVQRLHGLPTLDAQLDLLSRLPDFVDDVKASLAHLLLNKAEWAPGPHIPRSRQLPSEDAHTVEQGLEAAGKKLRLLHDHLFRDQQCQDHR
jgi:hypothetical protein